MNKFLDNIKAFQADNHVIPEPVMSGRTWIQEDKYSSDVLFRRMYNYRIEVKLGHDVTCPLEELEHHKKNIQRSISSFVYGDLERRLHEWFYSNNMRSMLNQEQREEFFEILEDMR
jgi:hypothetical protein